MSLETVSKIPRHVRSMEIRAEVPNQWYAYPLGYAKDQLGGTSQSISQHTTRRTLERVVISSRRPSRVPLVSQRNRKRRLFWAQKRRNWSLEDWKKVSWSDESRFLPHHTDDKIRIWRKQYEFMDRPSCQMTPLQAGGGGVMVWGMISWSALGPLISMDTTMNSTVYLNIIADHVHSLIFS
ncbi:hypothetical protein AVEN_42413-1 [Araneus ventricosus]|uniref:Transposase Tc1-like domain-containing protein n=1 Tax=Araneus ventricosus TaxID=182803 RepID=A0A4Y2QCA3_ARAVE|nr:hypothetical protein AVEN_42413-1 [Araneus ventricosus]